MPAKPAVRRHTPSEVSYLVTGGHSAVRLPARRGREHLPEPQRVLVTGGSAAEGFAVFSGKVRAATGAADASAQTLFGEALSTFPYIVW